jgi:DNA-binding NtrC family response regulator
VFYLDDEQDLLDIFQEMFGVKYDVRTSNTLAEARRILADHPFDIIISDQSMPDVEGVEFLREAAQAYPDSFRIMLTGHALVGEMMGEIMTGVIHSFVRKPWEHDDMQLILERAVTTVDRRRTDSILREDDSGL